MLLAAKQLQDFIKSNALFNPTDKILLAVSGGKDSVAMAHLFFSLDFKFAIAHCNFNLRGEESKRDEDFVKNLSEQFNAPFHLTSFETQKFAEENKISTQMAARDLRYAYFDEIRTQFHYQKIAIAQHQNDAIETVLQNLIRGTGIAGLHGIKALRENIIRPMLCFNSDDIVNIVKENNLAFVEDSSNASNKYIRNKIRLDIIPEMKKINPSLEQTFTRNLYHFNELEEFLNLEVEKLRSIILVKTDAGFLIKIADIQNLKPQNLLLFEILKPFNFKESVVKDIIDTLNGISGKQFFSNTHSIIIDRENILIHVIEENRIEEITISEDENQLYFAGFNFKKTLLKTFPSSFKVDTNNIYVDSDLLIYPLTLRFWKQGDSFKPFGMNGVKKLSDFFINQKINIQQKNNIPILINGDGKIIWVCGLRSDDRFKIKPKTKKIIIFTVEKY
ncbi:tRNA(Ile)-lysidine synthetase [Pedobacter psychrophilus]|uniref:tRNA(Ile)-lysidine synthase n=1 Tax=Pedobacter psychrophilus TaxID=1826909 RepID=A0A179DA88_9SPHI|nr:tRNA lysidine(34) synthetase TilS [Pedobacter psychrophilus]OAQ37966.1 tRNA(Ile)-lysidine synthetase [Pedobacter psychrophilus]